MQKEQMILTEKSYGIDSEISDKIMIVWQKNSMWGVCSNRPFNN